MPRITGPKLLIILLALFYGAFWLWYGGSGRPLTPEEAQHYFARLDARPGPERNPAFRAALEKWARLDDGREFFMVNLINDPADMEAVAAYNRAILPELLRRGSFPVFISRPFTHFMQPEGLEGWDQVAVVRYRSFRDILDIISAPHLGEIERLKAGSISKTHVFPTHMQFSFIWVRFIAAALLAAFGFALHLALRRFAFYSRSEVQAGR
jgi:hypothetical protein